MASNATLRALCSQQGSVALDTAPRAISPFQQRDGKTPDPALRSVSSGQTIGKEVRAMSKVNQAVSEPVVANTFARDLGPTSRGARLLQRRELHEKLERRLEQRRSTRDDWEPRLSLTHSKVCDRSCEHENPFQSQLEGLDAAN